MKKITKILLVFLIAALCVGSFAACGRRERRHDQRRPIHSVRLPRQEQRHDRRQGRRARDRGHREKVQRGHGHRHRLADDSGNEYVHSAESRSGLLEKRQTDGSRIPLRQRGRRLRDRQVRQRERIGKGSGGAFRTVRPAYSRRHPPGRYKPYRRKDGLRSAGKRRIENDHDPRRVRGKTVRYPAQQDVYETGAG